MTRITAKFYQEKKTKSIGFSVSEKTSQEIKDDAIFTWLIAKLFEWQIINGCQTGVRFALSRPIHIHLTINNDKRLLFFTETRNKSLKTFSPDGKKHYTIKNVETGTHSLFPEASNFERIENFIEHSIIEQKGRRSPEVSAPMRD